MSAAEHIPKPYKIRSCLSSSFSFPSSLPPASELRNHSEEVIDHICKTDARNCLVVVEVGSQPSSNELGGGREIIKKIESQILPHFSLVSDNNLFQKGMWHFLTGLPAIQHFTVFWSLINLPVVIWIMFPFHRHIKKKKICIAVSMGTDQSRSRF